MLTNNRKAFLDMIAFSEGTKGVGDDGYNVLVGSTAAHPLLFHGYADHPRIYNAEYDSTGAGRYQLLKRFFDAYKLMLDLPDFSPASQDAIALQQIKERRALDAIDAGDFDTAIMRCAAIWASLPGAGYGQRENKIADLRKAFVTFGGVLA